MTKIADFMTIRTISACVKLNIPVFSEIILKAIHQMTEKREDIEKLLKTYFTVGVTPECAESRKDADAFEGGTILFF